MGLDPYSWVGKHGRKLGVGEEDDEDGEKDDRDGEEEEGGEGHVLRGQSVGSGEPPSLGWIPIVGLDPNSWVGPQQLGWTPTVGLGNVEGDWGPQKWDRNREEKGDEGYVL